MKPGQPITPEEVTPEKLKDLPPVVIDTFNQLIARHYENGTATVYQDEVLGQLNKQGLLSTEIFANEWLNVEDIYRHVGWEVDYEKPGYNESGQAFFTFKRKSKLEKGYRTESIQ